MVTIKAWFKRASECVKKAVAWLSSLETAQVLHLVFIGLACFLAIVMLVAGCTRKGTPRSVKTAPTATAEQPLVSPEEFTPDFVCLRPGQTAMLLENIEVEARIPYQGGELWTGRVVIEKGSMVVKPIVEN